MSVVIEQGLPNFTNARQGARRLARRTLTALTGLQELNAKPTTQRPHDVVRTVVGLAQQKRDLREHGCDSCGGSIAPREWMHLRVPMLDEARRVHVVVLGLHLEQMLNQRAGCLPCGCWRPGTRISR